MMIEDDDILFLSILEDFQAPADHITDTSENINNSGRFENEKIPHVVGGFKVGELLGRGGFGEVRIGEHHLTGDRVALKFLRKSDIHSFNAAERTNTEIQCLTALKHANIIRLQQV
jgi:serine/threonine protein kinase